jgi:uncharacterized membrane protein (DUF106 family)
MVEEVKENKKAFSMLWFIVILGVSLYIASLWTATLFGKPAFVKTAVGSVLNPSLGAMLNWNVWVGFIVVIALTSLILTLAQKYLSDQAELKEMRKEQKILQEEMKKYKDHPEKMLEMQKKQLEFIPKTFELTMKPLLYTSIPIILLFRWFGEYLQPIFGGWWILYYLIGSLVFSSIFRKVLDVA